MSSFVLDASAVIAYLNQEPGADRVEKYLDGAYISTVNVAEVFTKSVEAGHKLETARESFDLLGLKVVEFSMSQAGRAAELRIATKKLGLSLGDRSCLALAESLGASAITTDRQWKKISFCVVEVIR
jgi:ribonuclease VapC